MKENLTPNTITVRSLILNANKRDSIENLEAPVPGAQSGSSANVPTTGEVNLYLDPETFGTEVPHFFADCEGMLGSEPAAAQYQKDWYKVGRRYLLQPKDGKQIDRKSAVSTIYPRFLYIFSDVICMVTRNQRAWATSAVRLLEWSLVGAHNTVNQCALPALIIVLNGPSVENEAWISEDHDATTRDFFIAIDREINEDTSLREMAKKVRLQQVHRAIIASIPYSIMSNQNLARRQNYEGAFAAELF